MLSFINGSSSHRFALDIILVISIIGIVLFIGVTSLLNRKNKQKEKEKRKREVRNKIKTFIREKESKKNLKIEFEKVIAKKGKKYKTRDVFEVIINISDAKSNIHIEDRAYEIEGISIPIDKKNFNHEWVVNARLDIKNTREYIKLIEGEIKLTKDQKIQNKKIVKEQKKQEYKEEKANIKLEKQNKTKEIKKADIEDKFIPRRSKNKE